MPYHFVDPEKLSTPKSGTFDVKVDEWWLVNGEGKLAFYVRVPGSTVLHHPQCNPDKKVADLVGKSYDDDFVAKQIPLVFIPHSCSDYR